MALRAPLVVLLIGPLVALAAGVCLFALVGPWLSPGGSCPSTAGPGGAVGASEYGGPGDPRSGVLGASGINLLTHPDSYAELGGLSFQTATMMGGLPYMTPLRISWGGHTALAYKRDFGLGGGPVDGAPRVIDLWWRLAGALRIPYERGLWSGLVRVARPPATGASALLGQSPQPVANAACDAVAPAPGSRAVLLSDGLAQAPADTPVAVREIIAAGNQIAGKPYVYGAAHGLALSEIAPAYDCSSSVEHLLYGAGLLPVTYGGPSGELEGFGAAGPGRWVTLYASATHVFMYVAGLRWDTWNAAGPGDGAAGIGWHPLIRSSAGFIARHPVGL